jgi:hypothetical protein
MSGMTVLIRKMRQAVSMLLTVSASAAVFRSTWRQN